MSKHYVHVSFALILTYCHADASCVSAWNFVDLQRQGARVLFSSLERVLNNIVPFFLELSRLGRRNSEKL